MQNMPDVNPHDYTSTGRSEEDKRLLVKFFIKPREDKEASIQGR